MTHEEHKDLLLDQLTSMLVTKYDKGQREHGGNLWDYSTPDLLDNAIEEVIDLAVYLLTLRGQL